MKAMNIHIDVRSRKNPISPFWFGHNLEHTRSCVSGGMSAQMIRNRKFAGRPQRTGQAAEWYRIGPTETLFLLDPLDPFTTHYDPDDIRRDKEMNGQRIENCIGGAAAGIGQDGVCLSAGRDYELRLVVKTTVDMPIMVRLVSQDTGATHFETVFEIEPGDWRESALEFTAPQDDRRACLEITFDVPGLVTVGAVSLLPGDHLGYNPPCLWW